MARVPLLVAALAALALAGCSLKSSNGGGGVPKGGVSPNEGSASKQLGFPVTATKNTTRVPGQDAVADAAGVASAVFPATSPATRPPAVALVDKGDWQGAIAAGVLSAPPVNAPTLLTDGDSLPSVTKDTLDRLDPGGDQLLKGSQTLLVGEGPPAPSGRKSTDLGGNDPYSEAAAVDHFYAVAKGKPSKDVVIASGEQSAYAMPAASWAARSGDAVLFVRKNGIPPPTRQALIQHQKPNIWVLGPPSVIGDGVLKDLAPLGGSVTRISGPRPVDNAIAFAKFQKGRFGWGYQQPGRNFTVANQSRPGDAAASAALGANGIYAPLLLTDKADPLPATLEKYFLDTEPGFANGDPNTAVYNHAWILGAEDALSQGAQGRIDQAISLLPVDQSAVPVE
ncbi:MAG: cell wall-binding repeat-containing protein [Thermoleophilaceae bacterium]